MRDVHHLIRLSVRLANSNDGGIHVHNGDKSSIVVNVKTKQDLDPSLVEFKRLVVEKKIKVFS